MNRDVLKPGILWAVLALWLAVSGVPARAQQGPTAIATLSRSEAGVGEEVELKIKLRGASQIRWQGSINVDGLEIQGPRMQSALGFGGLGALGEGMTLTFSVLPQREGRFTIPSIALSADGKALRTEPLDLVVKAGLTTQDPAKQQNVAQGSLEVVLPKKKVFVGEMVPVEIRLVVDSAVRWQPEAMPEIPGEGFTKQKLPEPKQEHETRNGREVDVLVFRTAITPSKAGKLTLGPIEIPYVAQVPRAKRNNRSRSLFDLFDDGVFGDPFFAVNQRFRARAEPVELDVQPLPPQGRPASFSGAVGDFKFRASGAPQQVKVGDPVTMTLTVSGTGNFDRIDAPVLADSTGWRGYPPSSNFKANDELNTSGTKTFSMAVIPESKQSAMPVFEFSYFDPDAAKYVTLKSEPAALTVTGAPAPPPAPAAVATDVPVPPAEPKPTTPSDILGLRYDEGSSRVAFAPLYRQRGFLLAQLVPFTALLVLIASRLRRSDDSAKIAASLRREKATTMAKLRGRELPDHEFLEAAAHAIQLETALATQRPAGSVDAATAVGSRTLDADTERGVERIFSTRAELLYAGVATGAGVLSAEDRRSMRETIERFERSRVHA